MRRQAQVKHTCSTYLGLGRPPPCPQPDSPHISSAPQPEFTYLAPLLHSGTPARSYSRYAMQLGATLSGSSSLVPTPPAPYASDAEVAAAPFTFQDWAHGIGGFSRVGRRLGGVCTGACDSDEQICLVFMSTFG